MLSNRIETKRIIKPLLGRSFAPYFLFSNKLLLLSLFLFSFPWTRIQMVPVKGTPTLKSDSSTRHSVFSVGWLWTWSFEICANWYDYCGPFVINGPNKSRLTNDGLLISLVVGHVGRSGLGVESDSPSCGPYLYTCPPGSMMVNMKSLYLRSLWQLGFPRWDMMLTTPNAWHEA